MSGALEFNIQTAPTGPEAPVQDGRPDHIPEKFWDASTKSVNTEALLRSYGELEKKVGTPAKEAQAQETQADAEDEKAKEKSAETTEAEKDAEEKAAEAAAESAGLKMADLQAEFDANGSLSDDSYAKLDAAGFDRQTVDDFIEFRASKADAYVASIHEAAGGADTFTKAVEWAAKGYSADQIAAFNEAVNSGNKAKAEAAAKALRADYVKANPQPPKTRINGGNGTGPSASGVYESLEQMLADQAKPEYRADPAFREMVRQKLARSKI